MDRPLLFPHGEPTTHAVEQFHRRLVHLLLEGHGAHLNVAGWIYEALEEAHERLPRGVEELLENRPGCWEADHIRRLVGRPAYLEQMHAEAEARLKAHGQ